MTKVVDDDRARQATPGRPILYVLIASLALVGVYLITMVGWSGSTSPPDRPATTSSTTSAPSSPNTARVPAGNPTYPAPASPSANPQGGSTSQ